MYKIIDGKQIEMTSEEVNAHNSWSETDAQKLMDDSSFTDPIPSNQADFVALVTARSDYKNRKARDDEAKE